MKLFGWLRGGTRADDPLTEWRRVWERAVSSPRDADLDALRRHLDEAAPAGGDVEIELEMLEALSELQRLHADVDAGVIPLVETQHRAVGTEPCHFTAPVSLPDDPGHAYGRLLITPTRAIFVGAGRTLATAWHAVHDILRLDRDVALLRPDRSAAVQFRFNTYTDAVTTAFLARHFKARARARL